MNHLQTVLERWVVEYVAEPKRYQRAFSNDINVLAKYLERVYGAGNSQLVLNGVGHADAILETIALLTEVLRFPVWSKLDPRDSETADWALFAVRRGVEIHPDIYAPTGRFEKDSEVVALLDAGVSLGYAAALDITRWSEKYPTDEVISAYQDGLLTEYARTVIYGARPS